MLHMLLLKIDNIHFYSFEIRLLIVNSDLAVGRPDNVVNYQGSNRVF